MHCTHMCLSSDYLFERQGVLVLFSRHFVQRRWFHGYLTDAKNESREVLSDLEGATVCWMF
jgi:hypothetical protein